MLNSIVLEVAIGLVFCFASVALIASAVYEALASWLNLRAKGLLMGIKSLLNAHDDSGEKLLLGIYNHALSHPAGSGTTLSITDLQKGKNNPSYMDARHFAIALIETIQSTPDDFTKLGLDINNIQNQQIRQLLRGMYDRAAGSMEQFNTQIATWFNASMDRISGSYKRQSQLWCFVIALVFAALFNVDSIHLFSVLWQHPVLVPQISIPGATIDSSSALLGLKELPIGWQTEAPLFGFGRFTIFGWLITATAALFGAPFWFDLLQRLTHLRGTGPKPQSPSGITTDTGQAAPAPGQTSPRIADDSNKIVELYSERNKDDPSYRPIQPEEKW